MVLRTDKQKREAGGQEWSIGLGGRCGLENVLHHPGTTGEGLVAALAVPNAHSTPLHRILAAEGAGVAGVLRDFHLLDLLPQGGAIASAVLAGHTNLLRALGLNSP